MFHIDQEDMDLISMNLDLIFEIRIMTIERFKRIKELFAKSQKRRVML